MELKQLSALVAIAETGSVTRAAEALRLAQPAVTRQIQALEHELGVELFVRTRQGMTLTGAGEMLLERARRALAEVEKGRAEVRPDPVGVHGIVTIGILESMLDLVAVPLVETMATRYPAVELRLLTAYSGYLQKWLDTGDLDLTLAYNLQDSPGLNVYPLAKERLWAVAPAAAGLDPACEVSLGEAVRHGLVLPNSGHGLRVLIDRALARVGVREVAGVETNSMRVQKHLVAAGRGWTVLPSVAVAGGGAAEGLSAAPLADREATRQVVLAVSRVAHRRPAVDAVAAAVLRVLEAAARDGRWPLVMWAPGR